MTKMYLEMLNTTIYQRSLITVPWKIKNRIYQIIYLTIKTHLILNCPPGGTS